MVVVILRPYLSSLEEELSTKILGNIQILRQRYLDIFFTNEKFMVNFITPKILRPIGWLIC